MLRRSLLWLCLFGCSFHLLAQHGYVQGYIVNHAGDTLRGKIDYGGWDKNPLTVTLRGDGSSVPAVYHPIDIRSFYVAQEFYESAILDVDTSAYKIAELNESSSPAYKKDTIFLQVLVRGEKSLFHLKDQKGRQHFYIDDNGLQHLEFKQYIQYIYVPHLYGYKKALLDNNRFKGQLANYLGGCGNIQTRMKNLRYTTIDLLKLFKHYATCVSKSPEYITERKDVELRAGIEAGISMSNLVFKDRYVQKAPFQVSVSPGFGLYADWKLLRSRGMTITNDVFFTSYQAESVAHKPRAATIDIITSSYDFKQGKTQHQLRFELSPAGDFFLSGGISLGFYQQKVVRVITRTPPGTPESDSSSKVEFGQLITLGYMHGKLGGELRFERSSLPQTAVAYTAHAFLKYRLLR